MTHIVSMGFERPDVERAMRAAFFNPDRAIEYLLNVGFSPRSDPFQTSNDMLGYPRAAGTASASATAPATTASNHCPCSGRRPGCGSWR